MSAIHGNFLLYLLPLDYLRDFPGIPVTNSICVNILLLLVVVFGTIICIPFGFDGYTFL